MLPKSPWCRKRSYHSIAAAGLALTGGLVLLLATSLAQAEDAAILTDAEAMTALSAPPSESRICQKLSSRLERMCQRNNLPDANAALCARIEEGLPGLCGKLDRILATPAAGGRLLAALAEDFSLELVDEKSDLRDSALHPLILTPEDLEEREITDYLAASYASGMTVAIVGANQEEANLFHNLAGAAGSANCAPDEGSLAITFYGLHRSIERQPPVVSSYCLPGSIDIEDEEETRPAARLLCAGIPASLGGVSDRQCRRCHPGRPGDHDPLPSHLHGSQRTQGPKHERAPRFRCPDVRRCLHQICPQFLQ